MKREIVNFSKRINNGVNKDTQKFIMDMQYGIYYSGSCFISEISRSLKKLIKLKNTIERLCDNLVNITDNELEIIENNYINEIKDLFVDESIALFDDGDVAKRYGKKFEDLVRVIDASSINKEIVNGYYICEAVILKKNEMQLVSIYSKIYFCKRDNFKSMNEYTS